MEVTHSLDRFYFDVTPLDAQLDDENHKQHSPVQLLIKFDYYIKHKHFNVSQDHNKTRTLIHRSEDRFEAVHQIDLCQLDHNLVNSDLYKSSLLYILSELGIDEDKHNAIVNEITDWGRIIQNLECNKDRKILSLWVYIANEHITFRCERCLMERESLVKKRLERVRVLVKDNEIECGERKCRRVVHESEICTICMDDFGVVDDVICTPCWHLFHDKCIVRWLGENHHCPLCRFEIMPI